MLGEARFPILTELAATISGGFWAEDANWRLPTRNGRFLMVFRAGLVVLLLAATRRYWGTGPAGESDRWIRVRGARKF